MKAILGLLVLAVLLLIVLAVAGCGWEIGEWVARQVLP